MALYGIAWYPHVSIVYFRCILTWNCILLFIVWQNSADGEKYRNKNFLLWIKYAKCSVDTMLTFVINSTCITNIGKKTTPSRNPYKERWHLNNGFSQNAHCKACLVMESKQSVVNSETRGESWLQVINYTPTITNTT